MKFLVERPHVPRPARYVAGAAAVLAIATVAHKPAEALLRSTQESFGDRHANSAVSNRNRAEAAHCVGVLASYHVESTEKGEVILRPDEFNDDRGKPCTPIRSSRTHKIIGKLNQNSLFVACVPEDTSHYLHVATANPARPGELIVGDVEISDDAAQHLNTDWSPMCGGEQPATPDSVSSPTPA